MRARWRGLELPTRVVPDQEVSTPTYGRFVVEPFERGFGTTVGNSIRRILLSSLEGSAVVSVKIAGVEHEFSSIKGVLEDTTDIILNVKNLIVKSHSPEPKVITVHGAVAEPITADMIEADPAIEIFNGDLVLATLTDNVEFDMEMVVQTGRGFVPAEEMINPDADQEIGRIYVDATFSPVTRVRYSTEDTRVGQRTNYDRLILEIWTNGTITPDMAMVEAAKIMRKHLNPFVQYFEVGEAIIDTGATAAEAELDAEIQKKLNMTIHELELSVRSNNCLDAAKIRTVRDLATRTEAELLKVRSFGKTSLREIKRKLADMGLSLGMKIDAVSTEEQGKQQETDADE
ncbi:MAG: DNA-directed RNA polymerase subunit alpha [Planctomycetota bacterium]|nr:DNA-directed RNA polymerase subunit alpha [Planctomycetota bacterium]